MGSTLSTAHLWALAAGANLTRPRGDRFDALDLGKSVEDVREALFRWWDVSSTAEAQATLDWLRDGGHTVELQEILRQLEGHPPHQIDAAIAGAKRWAEHRVRYAWEHRNEFRDRRLEAFDMVRLSFVARAAYSAGFLDKRPAWDAVFDAARRLQQGHDSWAEMSQNYLLGRRFWAGGDPKQQLVFDKHARWLETHAESPWRLLPWKMPLKTGFWGRYP